MRNKYFLCSYLVVFLTTFFTSGLSVKDKAQANKSFQFRLDATKPTVYISFEEFTKDSKNNIDIVRLRLHNNTRFPLYFLVLPEFPLPGDLSINYEIESEPGYPIINRTKPDNFIRNKLDQGKSASFTMSPAYLAKGYSIYVKFNYDWETPAKKISFVGEPEHRAYLHYYQIPSR